MTRRQLLALGLDAEAVRYRLKVGRLIGLHRGVYAVGHRPPSMHSQAMAAVLACGDGALLSHRSAGALWGMGPGWSTPMEVTVPGDRRPRGIRTHRSPLHPDDRTVHFGVPVTSPARTVLDLAPSLTDKALARAINESRLNHHLHPDDLCALLARSPGRATARIERVLHQDTGPTRSELEDEFLAFLDRYGLPRPEVNGTVAGYEVDMVWREQHLVVELDSRTHHDSHDAFETDRDRDPDLLAAGFPVVRVTHERLAHRADREAGRLARLLDLPRPTARAPSSPGGDDR